MHSNTPRATRVASMPAERSKAFVDAVVAIAMTLLILPLMESAAELGDLSIGPWFEEHAGQVLSFVLSFALIALFWIGHHRVFTSVERITTPLLWLQALWLLTIVWLPFITALTGHADGSDPAVVLAYIASMAAVAAVWLGVRFALTRRPDLHRISAQDQRTGVVVSLTNLLLFVLAGVLAWLIPGLEYFALFILFLQRPATLALLPLFSRWHPSPGAA